MEYIDTIKLDNGNLIKRYWVYYPSKYQYIYGDGRRELTEIILD